jgi:hypothetical protein
MCAVFGAPFAFVSNKVFDFFLCVFGYILLDLLQPVSGIDLASAAIQHPLPNCRVYYSQVTVHPQKIN